MVSDVGGGAAGSYNAVSKVAVVGANGTMGRLVTGIVDATDGFELFAAIGSRDDLSDMDGADIVVDFTLPQVSQSVVDHAVEQGIPVIVGTSGWSRERIDSLTRAVAERGTGAIVVPNFSVGSVLGSHFAALAARYFDSIEIVEAHHAGKIDSPSGTAVRTAEAMSAARIDLGPVGAPHVDQRARGQQVASIPVHSLRLRGLLAKQEVLFGGVGEVLTITHDTYSSDAYTKGITLALGAVRSVRGVVVGLGPLLGLDADAATDDDAPIADAPSGQTASTSP
ncbi:4-hydroxy-tetrahydrodipicolinate reductase [Herbiconiux sp. L3-i23]|uniref:4-hydroxy-tetrahydrodipicolinate reductase n=1 Tax=Herbiconiux sp. L3-i23 TaxID=2905871 RepID=UPI0020462BD9|nr:4-hydroxy-tetrahydrodipicolinate reductase [Herbiconiux sp. L3-i23]BDI22198.1 4-hydroxy-tetrahydrodipicolinate reductase [Herbiconiux sp. L3-i23]